MCWKTVACAKSYQNQAVVPLRSRLRMKIHMSGSRVCSLITHFWLAGFYNSSCNNQAWDSAYKETWAPAFHSTGSITRRYHNKINTYSTCQWTQSHKEQGYSGAGCFCLQNQDNTLKQHRDQARSHITQWVEAWSFMCTIVYRWKFCQSVDSCMDDFFSPFNDLLKIRTSTLRMPFIQFVCCFCVHCIIACLCK